MNKEEPEVSLTDTRPVIGHCDICGNEIHGADDQFVSDRHYLLDDGTLICSEQCLIQHFEEKIVD